MKPLALILSTLICTVFVGAAVTGFVLLTPDGSTAGLITATFGLSLIIYGPLLLGSITAYYDVAASDAARRHWRLWLRIVLAVEAICAILVVVGSIVAETPIWLPIVVLVVAVALTAGAIPIGSAIRRREARRPQSAWEPVDRATLLRKVRAIVITFASTIVVGTVAAVVLGIVLSDAEPDRAARFGISPLVGYVLEFACFTAGFAAVLTSLSIARSLRSAAGADFGSIRKIARVVVRGKDDPLDAAEQRSAARYAAVFGVFMRFQLAYIGLLYAGLILQQVLSLTSGQSLHPAFPLVLIVGLVALMAVLAPLTIARVRRADAYARVHADLLEDAGPANDESTVDGA